MADRYGMADRHWEMLRRTIARYPGVRRLILYGSRARGTQHSGSDFDLAIEAPGLEPSQWSQLSLEIDDLPLVYPIDLVWLERTASERLRRRILEEGKTVLSAEDIYKTRPAGT